MIVDHFVNITTAHPLRNSWPILDSEVTHFQKWKIVVDVPAAKCNYEITQMRADTPSAHSDQNMFSGSLELIPKKMDGASETKLYSIIIRSNIQ